MINLSNRVLSLGESETIAMARRSRELKSKGVDIINLSLGEPDFFTPQAVKDAAKEAIDKNFSFYTNVSGYVELREAICSKLKRDNQLDYTADQIVVSTGAKHSIINVFLTTINPGDEVIIPTPFWVSYKSMVELCGGIPVFVETSIENDFKFTASQIEAAITSKTKALIFSSPCNPTGTVMGHDDLKSIAEMLQKHPSILVISDEIYEYINFEGKHESIAQFPGMIERTVIINGLSKGFAMTGWRVGYIAAPLQIAKACDKIQGQYTSATSSISQKACEMAMKVEPKELSFMTAAFKNRRDVFLRELKKINGLRVNTPGGAFYLFPDVSAFLGKKDADGNVIQSAEDLANYLLDNAHVATVTGKAFGASNCIRLSYAINEDRLIEAANRIKQALEKLN